MFRIIQYLKKIDWLLMSSVFLLILIGIAELYSIALSQGGADLNNFKKQILFVLLGLFAMIILAFYDFRNFSSYSWFFYALGVLLLLGVLIFGKEIRGTQGWYQIGTFTVQPVEFVKIIAIIFLAKYFSSHSLSTSSFRHIFFSGLGVAVLSLLVLRQPDFGSAMILMGLWFFMLIVSGVRKKYIFSMIALGGVLFSISWFFFFEDYQKDRILTFLYPQENSLAEGYNIKQATIAIGSGGLAGRGIGFGSQSQLKFLPEAQNDFIFAAIAEELGFLGISFVLFLFSVFYYRLIRSIRFTKSDFSSYILIGVAGLIFIQMFINIGMNIGLLPVVGISLPFVSYGGSVIISSLIMVGICQNIIVKSKLKY
jgi:rod shape determining protein RodA